MIYSTLTAVQQEGRKTTLTTLPPEIRCKIYDYLFDALYRVEITKSKSQSSENDNQKKNKDKHLTHTRLRARNPRTQLPPPQTKHQPHFTPLPLSLILSCKTIYRETILRLYTQTQFVFSTTRTLSRFVHAANPTTLATAIHHVELNHVMYNEPRLLAFRVFKHRADLAFYLACEDLAIACRGLRVLHVDMRIGDWPVRMALGERWSWPLLTFERYGNLLEWAGVRLRLPGWKGEERVLTDVAREVERRVMRGEAFQGREDERSKREVGGRVRAGKVLRVVF